MPMLLERQEILDRLHSLVDESRHGRGRIALVEGEAGIGKTTVVSALAKDVPRDTTVYWGACDAVTPPRAFAPLFDVASGALPELSAALEAANQDRIFNALLSLIRSGPGRSRLVVFEDVHWADAATLDLLRVVGPRIGRANALLVATYRDHEIDAVHPLRSALGDLPADSTVTIHVPPLSATAVSVMARQTLLEPERLHQVTGGNPFFVTEVLAAYGRGLPVTVRDAVLARASRLSADADRTLRATAILAPHARIEDVLALAGADEDAIDECVRNGMLQRKDQFLTFRHELSRDAVLDEIPTRERQALHIAAINRLRSRRSDSEPELIAQHAIAANDENAILEFAPEAAKRAAAVGAHREAVVYLDAALRHAGTQTSQDRALLLEAYARSELVLGEIDRAVQLQREALALHRESGDVDSQSASLVALSYVAWLAGDGASATERAREALDLLRDEQPEGLAHGRAAAALAQRIFVAGGEDEAALAYAKRALEISERLGDEQTSVHALTTVGATNVYLGDEDGWNELEWAAERGRAANLGEDVTRALINLVEAAMDLWRFDDADRYAADAAKWIADREFDLYRDLLAGRIADLALRRGRWDEALSLSEDLLARSRSVSQVRARALTTIARVAARRGTTDSWPLLDDALALIGAGEIQDLRPIRSARIEAAWIGGDLDRASSEAALAIPLIEPQPDWSNSDLAFWAWRVGALQGPPAATAGPFRQHIDRQFRAAATAWAAFGCPYHQALALDDVGDSTSLLESLELLQRFGAAPLAARVSASLRDLGTTDIPRGPRPSTRRNPYALTVRELEILTLVGEGLRNAQIANRLVLSPKTVDNHVAAVLRKLRVGNRAAAREVAKQLRAQHG